MRGLFSWPGTSHVRRLRREGGEGRLRTLREMLGSRSMHHRNNFDGLRLIGALMVLVSHQFALSGRTEPHVVGQVSLGALGVLIFFSISGFLVGQSWHNDP